jgi:ribulose-phosphate 3-epimerase
MTIRVAPALLGADPLNLQAAINEVETATVPYLHLDVMDGHYTNDISSFGMRTIGAIRDSTQLRLDVHLQTLKPERYIDRLIQIRVDRVALHADASTHIGDTLDALQTAGISKGLVLNPDHKLELLKPYLDRLDFVVLMTSMPGTSIFQPHVADKIRRLRTILCERYLDTVELVADGGITEHTAPAVVDAGIDTLVAASAIFKAPHADVPTAIKRLTESENPSTAER